MKHILLVVLTLFLSGCYIQTYIPTRVISMRNTVDDKYLIIELSNGEKVIMLAAEALNFQVGSVCYLTIVKAK